MKVLSGGLFRPIAALLEGGLWLVYIFSRVTINPFLRLRRVIRHRPREADTQVSMIGNLYRLKQLKPDSKL